MLRTRPTPWPYLPLLIFGLLLFGCGRIGFEELVATDSATRGPSPDSSGIGDSDDTSTQPTDDSNPDMLAGN